MPKLIVTQPGGDVREFALDGVVTIGRSSDNTVRISEERASRHHARVLMSGNQYIVEDLKSSNGTAVNGLHVQRKALRHGDEISIGKVTLLYQDEKSGDLIGQVVGGYRVLSKIGQGGMGAVYKALQVSMDRVVALKVLKQELTESREFIRGFMREARVAGQLNHPAIIQVHDFGEDKGTFYFSMEYVEGETVQAVLDREGKIATDKAVEVAIGVTEALCHARMHQVVHQDIKPQNIMINRVGQVKLADLGLAMVGGGQRPEQKSGPAVIMGTPHYMAPEQGKREQIDCRTDIYALGCSLFHMVTGRVPFDGANSLAVITKHITQERPNPRQYDITLPESMCNLIRWMMAIEPKERPQTPEIVLDGLKKIMADVEQRQKQQAKAAAQAPSGLVKRRAPIPSRSKTAVQAAAARAANSLLVMGIIVVTLLIIVIAGVVLLTRDSGDPGKRGRPTGGGETPPTKTVDAGKRTDENAGKKSLEPRPPDQDRKQNVPPPVDPKADQNQPNSAAEESASRAFDAAMDSHRRAMASGDFLRARSVLRQFAERYPGTKKTEEARSILKEIEDTLDGSFKRIADQADKFQKAQSYGAATTECSKLLTYDPQGKWGKRAREILDKCDSESEPAYRRFVADAEETLKKGNLQDAIDLMDRCLDRVAGTKWAEAVSSRQVQLLRARQFVDRLEKAVKDRKAAGSPASFKIEYKGSYYNTTVEDMSGVGVDFQIQGRDAAKVRKTLNEMPYHELHDLVETLKCDKDLLGMGCLLLVLGNKEKAMDALKIAAAQPGPLQQAALGLMTFLEGARNVIAYDFSKVADLLDWQAENGSWTIVGGQYVLETDDGGDTKLSKEFSAKKARISFDFEPKKTPIVFCAELAASETRAVSATFSGDQVTVASNIGEQRKQSAPCKLSAGKRVRVQMEVEGDDVKLIVDGGAPVTLAVPGVSAHRGCLVFRIRDSGCSIDNVQMRNME